MSPKVNAKPEMKPSQDVILFVKADKDYPFWKSAVSFAEAVAGVLSLRFTAHYIPQAHRDRFNSVEYIKLYLKQLKNPPSLVISSFFLGAEEQVLQLFGSQSIAFISLNSNISHQQFSILGKPRERFPLWLGHISPNDVVVGKQLVQSLLRHYRANKNCDIDDCNANIYGFAGLPFAAASRQRKLGVESVVSKDNMAHSYDIVPADWRRHIVGEKMNAVVYRYPDIDIFWAASDTMAWGIVDGIKNNKYKQKVLIGGIDWAPETIPYIKNGDMTLSLGGHFLEAGIALILYYDYLNGLDFAAKYGTVIETKLSELNQQNLDLLGSFLAVPQWKESVLKKYSKFNNPARQDYVFDPQTIIRQQLN
ncbi:ABC transporter substrate-binding protein [Paraglaciecola aquimarina]|uniref:ABC transporter substrate-binding protein n=1 Tax=Paraglaciecola algarum TaxID=3050085 RepID=A0ABS9D3Q5_9ALTE|nr:ABC transporter substrate-binding protein [Paraglaciecola sp. G1-23]MCF2946673.1 ABC transporter substrate-binding protein [Paraglaciecola sp. G1-23]